MRDRFFPKLLCSSDIITQVMTYRQSGPRVSTVQGERDLGRGGGGGRRGGVLSQSSRVVLGLFLWADW